MGIPPFPDVPTAPIAAITYTNLAAEADKVYEACSTDGFFYLDLTGNPIVKQAEELRDLAVSAFEAPLEEKMKYKLGKNLAGYKPAGAKKSTDSTLKPDATEFFNIYTDHVQGFVESRDYPPSISDPTHWTLFKQFTNNAHCLGNEILGVLAKQLGISPSDFSSRNAFGNPSGSHCRLTKKPPSGFEASSSIGLPSHTDFGSITILFNWLGGLQIEHRGEWKYIKPLANHAIINLGDATRRFTNGALLSAKHRVVPSPGEQATVDRYSVVYFIRPGDDVLMEPLQKFKTEDGELKKVAGKFQEADDRVLTAGEWMSWRQRQMVGNLYD